MEVYDGKVWLRPVFNSWRKLVERPREYQVSLTFHPVNDLSPPIIEIMDVNWRYPTKDGGWGCVPVLSVRACLRVRAMFSACAHSIPCLSISLSSVPFPSLHSFPASFRLPS